MVGSRTAARVFGGAVAALALAGCGTGTGGGAAGSPTITVYSGQHPQTTALLVAAFERQTGIRVVERDGDEDVLAQQVVQEGGRSPADVFYAENSPALQFLSEKGRLSPVARTTLSAVPATDNSPGGSWVGVTARVSGIVYNTRLVPRSQVPTSLQQLADSRWAGKIGLAPSETDFEPVITSLAHSAGHAGALSWLEGLKRNAGAHVYPDNETLTAQVNAGQVALGIVDHYYWYRLRYELGAARTHSAFATFAPGDPGYVLDVSGAAVLRASRNQAAAQRFVAFLVSPAGQEVIARSQSYEYPLGSGVATTQPVPPFASLRPAPVSVAELGDGSGAVALLHEAQLL